MQSVPKDDQCKVTDLKSSGSKVTWKFECKGVGQIVCQGGSVYEGWARMQAQGMVLPMKYKAKRLGECQCL